MQVIDPHSTTSMHVLTFTFAVLYYSNDILSKSLPEMGPYISLGITIVNTIMTFTPIFLIDVRLHFVVFTAAC